MSYIFMPVLLFLVCGIASCSNNKLHEVLDRVESLLPEHPDSALLILKEIDRSDFGSGAEKARYGLLMSMAMEDAHIDVTTFDILQPAIDYYLKKGNAREKLRTYYCQGRIYQNRGDIDNALGSFVNGADVSSDSADSLMNARTYAALGNIYDCFYDFGSYTDSYLRAAEIYGNISLETSEFDCLLNAINGAIILGNESLCDSLLDRCGKFKSLDDTGKRALAGYRLSHVVEFGSPQQIKDYISSGCDYKELDVNGLLNLALAYNKVGDYEKARDMLDRVGVCEYDTLKYKAISVSTLEGMGEYKEALADYKDFSNTLDSINALKFDQKAQSIDERHRIELKAGEDARLKSRIIWGCIGGLVLLVMAVIILILAVRSNRISRDLAVQKARTTGVENERLKSEKERLAVENKNLQLERDNKSLEAENLAHRVEMLENESDELKKLMETQEELPSEVRQTIKVRIEMLNSLLAGYITANDKYEKPYDAWVKELTENTEDFMNSNRLAFQASHPQFIQYFEEHGLTVDEINYVCLYAIGLRGKEVGNYMKKRSHVNTSSAIRKKLGIDKHETNIGIYVRKLLKAL